MRKIKVFTIVLLMLFMVGCTKDKKEDDKKNDPTTRVPISEKVADKTEKEQKDLVISDLTISENGASIVVKGKIQNPVKTKTIILELKLRNSEKNRVLGVARTEKIEIAKNEEKTFEISLVGNYGTIDEYKINVLEEE